VEGVSVDNIDPLEAEELPVTNTDEITREIHIERSDDREYPWVLRAIREFGFPVATALILMGILGFVGKWMIDNQQKLLESTVRTNEALTANLAKNAETLVLIERNMSSMETKRESDEKTGIALINSHMEMTKRNEALNTKQVEILEGVTKTHAIQIDQLGKIVSVMDSASKLMEPVPRQREESLKKQDETNQKLTELLEVTKKRS
jgi:hypothetical protein